jgi:choline kinase
VCEIIGSLRIVYLDNNIRRYFVKAIILSAGQGKRLLPLTAEQPKCALPVDGQPILRWQLQQLAAAGVDEAVVVTGFRADAVDRIVASVDDLPVRTLYNPFFAASDNLGTCWIARHEMDQPFMIVNGDTLFEAAIPHTLLASNTGFPITLATDAKGSYDSDDMKIVSHSQQLLRVGKSLDLALVNGESIGMMVFRGDGVGLFRDRLEHSMRYGDGLKRWYLSVIDALAQESKVGICPISGLSWCEVDDQNDLANAQKVVGRWPNAAVAVA